MAALCFPVVKAQNAETWDLGMASHLVFSRLITVEWELFFTCPAGGASVPALPLVHAARSPALEPGAIRNVPSPSPGLAPGHTEGSMLVVTPCLSHTSALRDGTETQTAWRHVAGTETSTAYLE